MAIQRLPASVAGKIAAGEVVERPASVVKELVENAIDAGATEIRVEVREGGQRLIRVSDNGSGISADEIELAFEHHATSKLRTADELFAIHTLGFRGEALPSIAAVSHVTILSRTRDEAVGTQLRIEGGQLVARESRAAPAGTILTVEELFYNVPVRRKFLRTNATENALISEIVTTYALAYPDRRFSLVVDGRQAFQSAGSGQLADAIAAVYGVEMAKEMIELPTQSEEGSAIILDGYLGGPALHRPTRKYITLFVNGRAVRSPILTTAIEQAYQSVVPTGRHPVTILRIALPPDEVDVNVHPQKQEVKFARSDQLFGAVQRAVRRRLVEASPVHRYSRPTEPLGEPADAPNESDRASAWPTFDRERYAGTGEADEPQGSHRRGSDYWTQVAAASRPAEGPQLAFGGAGVAADGYEIEGTPRLPPLRVLGQVQRTFLVCEGPDGLYLVDQHTAHERILLERFQKARAARAVPSQRLLAPLALEMTPQQIALIEEQQETLLRLGFEVEPFGGQMVIVRALPELIQHHPDPAAAMTEILDGAIADRSGLSWEERLVMYAACRGAVKAGDALTLDEMRDLIRQLEECDLSRTCAHGRPTVVRLSHAQLEREFGRR